MEENLNSEQEIIEDTEMLELQNLQMQIQELTASLQRERADNVNILRRSEEDSLKAVNNGKAAIIKLLLPTIDTYEKARKLVPKELLEDKNVAGLVQILENLVTVLNKAGLMKIESEGKQFNSEIHQAVNMIAPTSKKQKSGNVAQELLSGYMLGDQLLRAASVSVYS